MSTKIGVIVPVLVSLAACSATREASPPRASNPGSPSAVVAPPPRADPRPAASPLPLLPATKLAPPYDRQADARELADEARLEFGDKTQSELVEGSFLLVQPRGSGRLQGPIDITRRALAAYFNGRFSTRPAKVISVYLFPDDSGYQRWCKTHEDAACTSPYGFYLSAERKIVMNVGLGIGTLTHELVHPLVEADFPDAPDWINEGIASLFEQFYLPRPGEIHGGKNWRLPRLLAGLASKKDHVRATPAALFGMSDAVFRGADEDLHYATARYLCQWLDQKGLLWSFYQRFRDHYAQDPSGETAFRDVVGKSPAEVSGEFERWARAL
jgi:hypothetical protein